MNRPQKGQTRRLTSAVVIFFVIFSFIFSTVSATISIPVVGTVAFIQTTGARAPLGIGDYRTHFTGDNQPHRVVVNVPCTPNLQYTFQLFDPAVDIVGNPVTAAPPFAAPGFATGVDGTTPTVIDEPRDGANTAITLRASPITDFDITTFQLVTPAGVAQPAVVYNPGDFDRDWTTLGSVTLPAVPTPGVDCGAYTIVSSTGDGTAVVAENNDDNAWRFRMIGGNAFPEAFDPTIGFDGQPGTGDEAWVGLQFISYQHLSGSCPANTQNFYWFADDGETNMFMINFDLDGTGTVSYIPPTGGPVAGLGSGNTVWNDAAPAQAARPTFVDMAATDAFAAPAPGMWTASLCVGGNNQYSFEVPNNTVFLSPPILPDVTIAKTDGVTTVTSPGTTSYSITITNISAGAAMPIAGPEVIDVLPPGMTFISCSVNAPLVGTCAETAPGSNTINVELGALDATTPAYLTGNTAAPLRNSGTITVNAGIVGSLVGGTTLINNASVDFTDIYRNNYPPRPAQDTNTVQSAPAITIVKTANNPNPQVGDTVIFTFTVTNTGNVTLNPVTVNDSDFGAITLALTTLTPGQSTTGTTTFTFTAAGQLPHTNTATVSGVPPAGPPVTDDDTLNLPQDVADLSLTKTVNTTTVAVGGNITYTLTLTNAGPANATGVNVSDPLPFGLTFVSTNPAGVYNSGTGVWTVGAVAAGASTTLQITARVDGPGSITNTAQVSNSDQFDPDSTPGNGAGGEDDQASAAITASGTGGTGGTTTGGASGASGSGSSPSPALLLTDPFITKSVNPPFALPGESVTWTITITNPGTIPATNVVMSDNLPAQVEIQSVNASSGSATASGQTVTFTQASLNPGESVTILVRTRVRLDAQLPYIINNQACMSSPVQRCAQATISSVSLLPITGETPWWRTWLLIALPMTASVGAYLITRRRRFYQS